MSGPTASPDAIAASLVRARLDGGVIARPMTELDLDLDAAYLVQRRFREQYCADGERRPVGFKLSATGTRAQARLGLAEPVVGVVFSDDLVTDEDGSGTVTLPRQAFRTPLVEAEIAFVLRRDLPELCSRELILEACDVAPLLEFADSRYADWPERVAEYSAQDIVVDNALSGRVVLGATRRADSVDLRAVTARLTSGRRVLASSGSPMTSPDPVTVVAWLARALHRLGGSLPRGSVIATGAVAGPVAVPAGPVRAELTGIGSVTASLGEPVRSARPEAG